MTNREKVLRFLESIAPRQATNEEIRARTGVSPHQQVFQITQSLLRMGRIKGLKAGSGWVFWFEDTADAVSGNVLQSTSDTRSKSQSGFQRTVSTMADASTASHDGQEIRVVIQCAASKSPTAGFFRTQSGQRLVFVARPDKAPAEPESFFARPDDLSDDGRVSWRARLVAYNEEADGNVWGLLPAYRLYTRPEYRELVRHFGSANVYILSAGWGLIRADFLTPYYDITFSSAAERWKRRGTSDDYADFCQLSGDGLGPILFLGGKNYQPLFEQLTTGLPARKVIFHRSEAIVRRPGFAYMKYDTPARTNWHYLCAQDLVTGTLPLEKIGAG